MGENLFGSGDIQAFNGFIRKSWIETFPEFFGFSNTAILLTQSVGFRTGSMVFKSTVSFNSFSDLGFKAGVFSNRSYFRDNITLISKYGEYFWGFLFLQNNQKTQTKYCSSLTFMSEIRFIRFRLSLVDDNPRIGTDFESAKINKTSKWPFLCFRVSGHFPSTGISELLHMDNLVGFRIKLF